MTLSLSTQDKVDIRRHTGYGMFGDNFSNNSLVYYQFIRQWAMLEYRMAHMIDEEVTVCQTYIAQCNSLETAIWSVDTSTKKAAVWTWNDNELGDKLELYTIARKQLLSFLQMTPGPWFVSSAASNSMSVRMIV